MAIELTEQQRDQVRQSAGQPVELVDPQTRQIYVLVAREQYDRGMPALNGTPKPPAAPEDEVAEGIRRSQEALRRDLPKMLEKRKLRGQFVAYHRDEQVGIAKHMDPLIQECIRRGYADDEYYVGWIHPTQLIEEPEI